MSPKNKSLVCTSISRIIHPEKVFCWRFCASGRLPGRVLHVYSMQITSRLTDEYQKQKLAITGQFLSVRREVILHTVDGKYSARTSTGRTKSPAEDFFRMNNTCDNHLILTGLLLIVPGKVLVTFRDS